MASEPFPAGLLAALRAARHVAILTGAGISAESGIPTFRDAQSGLWARFRPEELATPEAFRRNPKLVWDWYAWRRSLVMQAHPNAGHAALARLQTLVPRLTLVTQNIDSMHQRAGSRDVIELHGNITRVKCFDEGVVVTDWVEGDATPPRCPRCGGWLRPDVVWFGEMLPADALARAEAAAGDCDVFFSIGTSAAVFPAAQLPHCAIDAGATVVEVNKDATPLSRLAAYSFRAGAGEALSALLAAAWPSRPGDRVLT